jgi:hypothetical protein
MASSKLRQVLGVKFGLENDEPTEPVEAAPVETEVAAAVEPVAAAAAEVAQTEEVIEDVTEAAESLEAIAIDMQALVAEGGMTPATAKAYHSAVQAHVGQFGFESADIMPNLAAFGSTSGRVNATVASVEGIGQVVKDMWEAIKTQLKKLWASLKNWYLKVLDAAPRIKKHAEALKKKAEETTGKAENAKIDLSIAKAVHKNGTVTGFNKAQVDEVAVIAKAVLGAPIAAIATDVAASLGDVKADAASAAKVSTAAGEGLRKVKAAITQASVTVADAEKRYGAGAAAHSTAELPGGVVVAVVSVKADAPASAMTRAGLRLDIPGDKKKDVESSASFQTLSPGDAGGICDSVIEICDAIMDFKKEWDARDKAMAELEKSGDKVIKELEKGTEAAGVKKPVTDAVRGASSFVKNTKADATKLIGYFLDVSRASLTYVEKSLSQYKKD